MTDPAGATQLVRGPASTNLARVCMDTARIRVELGYRELVDRDDALVVELNGFDNLYFEVCNEP